ncbi:response regulator transcription factor [Vulgatibacter sp.]|uniref:response regulator transcription factor n=1 Tax=Vulgatibacter sp. TaxID=1971226 RepID=UPI0035635632
MHRHRVLLIEDEAELAELLGELLRDFDYDVRVAGSIGQAEEHLATWHPCAVVTDVTLPDVSRDDLVPRLRGEVGNAPIVLMSAIAPGDLRKMAEEQGAQGVISKPFELDEFERAVRFECAEIGAHP